jgi:hypothetical protein
MKKLKSFELVKNVVWNDYMGPISLSRMTLNFEGEKMGDLGNLVVEIRLWIIMLTSQMAREGKYALFFLPVNDQWRWCLVMLTSQMTREGKCALVFPSCKWVTVMPRWFLHLEDKVEKGPSRYPEGSSTLKTNQRNHLDFIWLISRFNLFILKKNSS